MEKLKHIALGTLVVLIVIVVFQNTATVETKVLFISISMPRALLLTLTLLVGAVVGFLYGTKLQRSRKKEEPSS